MGEPVVMAQPVAAPPLPGLTVPSAAPVYEPAAVFHQQTALAPNMGTVTEPVSVAFAPPTAAAFQYYYAPQGDTIPMATPVAPEAVSVVMPGMSAASTHVVA